MQGWKEGKMRVGWTDREPGNQQGDGMGGEISEPSWFTVHSIGHGLCPEDCEKIPVGEYITNFV